MIASIVRASEIHVGLARLEVHLHRDRPAAHPTVLDVLLPPAAAFVDDEADRLPAVGTAHFDFHAECGGVRLGAGRSRAPVAWNDGGGGELLEAIVGGKMAKVQTRRAQQAPGPPPIPQPPEKTGAPPRTDPPAPPMRPRRDTSFSSFSLWQDGQTGVRLEVTKASNSWPQAVQTYSNRGINR
jgi:hypothetical protein